VKYFAQSPGLCKLIPGKEADLTERMILKTFLKVNSTECLRRSDGASSISHIAPSSFSSRRSKPRSEALSVDS
jgi:hypothetical protein